MKDDLARARWRKSSRSSNQGQCVEAADLPGGTAVRDSKNVTGPVLTFTTAEWSAFTTAIHDGQFD
jgi:hypothetical protein